MVTVEPPVESTAPRRPARLWAGLRPLLVRLHFYVGLFVGPFLLVAAVTGLLYTLTPQLERFVHADALTAPVTGSSVPLADQVAAAAASQPGLAVTEIRPAPVPGATTRVTFDAGLPNDYARTAFVDPSTGRVQATLDTYGEWLPVRAWFDELHRSLLLGDVGRIYSELAASWLWVLALSGLAIWAVRRRPDKRLRRLLLPRTGATTGRSRLLSWHGAIGTWILLGALFLSATGLTWSQFAGGNVTTLRTGLDWSTPSVSRDLGPAADPAVPAGPVGTQAALVLDAARGAGVDGPVEIVPGDPGEAWSVAQTTRSWPTRQDSAAVDPATGRVTEVIRFDDWPLAAKLARWGVDAHMGILFGVVNQVVLALFTVGLIAMVVLGYRMWWRRGPLSGPPGARARPSFAAVATVGGVAVLVGLAVPLLGVSLIAFLVVDGLVQSWRDRAPAPPTAAADEEPAAR